MYLSFDEWNAWYQKNLRLEDWKEAPPILEERYSLLDALVFGGLGITLINRSDRVRISCLAQLVNVIAPIFTEKGGRVIRQSIYYPFQLLSQYGKGTVLKPVMTVPETETVYGKTPLINACVVWDEIQTEVRVFALNIAEEPLCLALDGRSFGGLRMLGHICLDGPDLAAANSFERPNAVRPRNIALSGENQELQAILPARSWNMLRLA
ncbi:MAG: hypothetical protein LBS62_12495 [Clostridiales bacterium]|nr:hypothetical protein [Clostridiales bacterium]